MNHDFRCLMEGADLIALEKDRYWMAPDGISLSAGPFVAALESATGETATVVGKPLKASSISPSGIWGLPLTGL